MFSGQIDQELVYTLAALLPLVLQLGGLAFAAAVDAYFGKREKRIFLLILILVLCLIAQNYVDMLLCRGRAKDLARTISAIVGYVLRPVILLLIYYLVEPGRSFRLGWILVGINTVVHLTAFFSPICFSIRNNTYEAGPLSRTCLVVSLVLLAGLVWMSVLRSRKTRGKEIWIPVAVAPIVLVSVLLDYRVGAAEQPVTFLTIAIVGCCTLYYLWPHLQSARQVERQLQERQRMQIMLSQIKPHFLYNTLSTIEALCLTDPKAANRAAARLSEYLRGNLATISEDKTIPFEKELSHARLYLELEQTRFEDALQVVWHVDAEDFFLPPLTLEPLVENAVRHGVRAKPDGRGTVEISAAEGPDCYEITVRDDGPGFDPAQTPADGRPHIGLRNVRERLESRGGSLTISSVIGTGTTATIRIPKNEGGKLPC